MVAKTEGYEVDRLEKLYALLCQSVYRHRKEYDKTALLQVLQDLLLIQEPSIKDAPITRPFEKEILDYSEVGASIIWSKWSK